MATRISQNNTIKLELIATRKIKRNSIIFYKKNENVILNFSQELQQMFAKAITKYKARWQDNKKSHKEHATCKQRVGQNSCPCKHTNICFQIWRNIKNITAQSAVQQHYCIMLQLLFVVACCYKTTLDLVADFLLTKNAKKKSFVVGYAFWAYKL